MQIQISHPNVKISQHLRPKPCSEGAAECRWFPLSPFCLPLVPAAGRPSFGEPGDEAWRLGVGSGGGVRGRDRAAGIHRQPSLKAREARRRAARPCGSSHHQRNTSYPSECLPHTYTHHDSHPNVPIPRVRIPPVRIPKPPPRRHCNLIPLETPLKVSEDGELIPR